MVNLECLGLSPRISQAYRKTSKNLELKSTLQIQLFRQYLWENLQSQMAISVTSLRNPCQTDKPHHKQHHSSYSVIHLIQRSKISSRLIDSQSDLAVSLMLSSLTLIILKRINSVVQLAYLLIPQEVNQPPTLRSEVLLKMQSLHQWIALTNLESRFNLLKELTNRKHTFQAVESQPPAAANHLSPNQEESKIISSLTLLIWQDVSVCFHLTQAVILLLISSKQDEFEVILHLSYGYYPVCLILYFFKTQNWIKLYLNNLKEDKEGKWCTNTICFSTILIYFFYSLGNCFKFHLVSKINKFLFCG